LKPKQKAREDEEFTIDSGTRIGHVHLKVANLARSVDFYSKVLGFKVTSRIGGKSAFLSAGGYHHHIGLNTWESEGGKPAEKGTTGLYHYAILMPTRKALAQVLMRLVKHNWPIEGASDHGVSESIYFRDPDGNGIEIYCDRPKGKWPKGPSGDLQMYVRPLNLDDLIKETVGSTDRIGYGSE
jgi:catechol 2,3-dioxygenase